jgi:hypothetical protein
MEIGRATCRCCGICGSDESRRGAAARGSPEKRDDQERHEDGEGRWFSHVFDVASMQEKVVTRSTLMGNPTPVPSRFTLAIW